MKVDEILDSPFQLGGFFRFNVVNFPGENYHHLDVPLEVRING